LPSKRSRGRVGAAQSRLSLSITPIKATLISDRHFCTTGGDGVVSLAVVRKADGWTIIVSGRSWGRFAYKVDAEEAALRLANQMRQQGGGEVQVMVQERWGELTPLAC
jgi:hypothetical protein